MFVIPVVLVDTLQKSVYWVEENEKPAVFWRNLKH